MPPLTTSPVLICDDNRDIADSMSLVLEVAGFNVCKTYTGRDALLVAEAKKPKVALLDIGLPDIDGYEVTRTIRAKEWAENMLIVAITGYGTVDDKERAYEAGFNYHITKPLSEEQLDRLLDELEQRCGKA